MERRESLKAEGVEIRLGECEGEAVSLEVTLVGPLESVQKFGCVGPVVVLAQWREDKNQVVG